jgi:hypothetical protein
VLESRPPINHKQIPQALRTLTQGATNPKTNIKGDVSKTPFDQRLSEICLSRK